MDFAVCPACGQSVLEDDAENCPFCGSSMKAKPGAKPAVKAAASPAKPAAKAASKAAADDLPFEADANVPQTAVQVSPTQSKARTLKVVCPMCDTVGYVAPSAAGKNVRCANPKCHVPVFTAPAPQLEAPSPPPEKKKGSPLVLGMITAVVVSIVGLGIWMVAGRPSTSDPQGQALTPEKIQELANARKKTDSTTTATDNSANTTVTDTGTPTTPVTPTGPSDADMLQQTLQNMREISLTGSPNRSKPYCRRLAAESAVLAGDIALAREHMDQLIKVGPDLPYYRIGPHVEIFWQEHAKKSTKTAGDALTLALADAAKLNRIGRDQLDLATRLATALAAGGRAAEGRELIKLHQSSGLEGETSAYLQAIAADPSIIDARRIELRPILPRQAPQAAAATALLVLHGQPVAALEWAKGWEELHIKAECLTALVEAAILEKGTELPNAEIAALPPENQLLLWARAARRQAARNQTEAAKDSLGKAAAQLDALTPPAEFLIPDITTLMKWKPASNESLTTLAAGASELAVVQQLVAKDAAAVQKALDVAMQACRGIGPTPIAIGRLQAEAENLGAAGLRQKIKTELELRTDDQARQQVIVYRRVLTDLSNASQDRFNSQVTILSRAAQAGLEDAVWKIVGDRAAESDAARREPYFDTEVGSWLVEQFRRRGADDLVKAVNSAAADLVPSGIRRPAVAEFEDHAEAGRIREAVSVLQRNDVKPEVRESLVLTRAIRLAAQDPLDKEWQFIGQVPDIVLREQALEYAALIATRRGQGAAIFKQIGNVAAATEKMSLGRGLVAGLTQSRSEK
jgi:hypothetical protein